MIRALPILPGILFIALASAAQAQITFSAPVPITTTDGSQIVTLGSFVDAVAADGSGNAGTGGFSYAGKAITIGDETFNPFFPNSGPEGDSVITFSGFNGGNDGSHSDATPFLTVLDGVAYVGDFVPADSSTETVTLNDLKIGDVYQVQVFQDGGFKTDVTGSNTITDLTGAYTLGKFTALNTTQSFTYSNDGADSSGIAAVDAISLRDITNAPEPSTYAMMIIGLAAVGFCVRRKLA